MAPESDSSEIFVWRDTMDSPSAPFNRFSLKGQCIYCDCLLQRVVTNYSETPMHFNGIESLHCSFCGWGMSFRGEDDDGETWFSFRSERTIKKILDINSCELYIEELGLYVKNNFDKIGNLTPRKFEILVADIFKNVGYRVQLTKQTRDGGFDMVLSEDSGKQILVEAKRYKNGNVVGVGIVRQLLGVELLKKTGYAKIVTSSTFSNPAKKEAKIHNDARGETLIELLDATDLLKMLEVYNSNLSLVDILKFREKERKNKRWWFW
jgi:hypothetical protein